MDIAKLAKDIGTLRYETEYRFEIWGALLSGAVRGRRSGHSRRPARSRRYDHSRERSSRGVSTDLRCGRLRADNSVRHIAPAGRAVRGRKVFPM